MPTARSQWQDLARGMERIVTVHTLRTIFLLLPIFFALAGPAPAELPFAPLANQPDYVVTMIASDYGKKTIARKVTHHGDWTRVDEVRGSHPTTEYISANGTANVRIYGGRSVISFLRGSEPNYSDTDREARNTGERQTHLGENCTVWDVWRKKRERTGYNLSHLSCITGDGIELWQSSVGDVGPNGSAEATYVERRPVTLEEARPPRALLTLDCWDQNTPTPTTSDHETIMELSGNSVETAKSMRITRRLGPWQYLEETISDVRRKLEITHDSNLMRLEYASGTPERLTIMRLDPEPADATAPASLQPRPADMNRSETILGETCRWFDMMPGMADASRSACLANDGIVLKDERHGRSAGETWTAVRVTRRPVSLDEIKPPTELLGPQRWGIE
jgi:hypothetical protein